jgi:hypothetical protein
MDCRVGGTVLPEEKAPDLQSVMNPKKIIRCTNVGSNASDASRTNVGRKFLEVRALFKQKHWQSIDIKVSH